MSITVEVGLLSGKTVTLNACPDEQVETLKLRAQTALGVGNGQLVNSSGHVLDACSTIKDGRLRNGDSLTLHISRVQIQASDAAFAAILGDATVVTWGEASAGGDSRAVQHQLKSVRQLRASSLAFAAICSDGSVVTWGGSAFGGNSGAVQSRLKKVQQIQANRFAFAAILADGSVVTWGDEDHGGNTRAVRGQLQNVQQIQGNQYAFAA